MGQLSSQPNNPKSAQGLTILELVMVLAIIAILVNVAIPGFYVMQQNMRVSSDANKLHGLIHYARSAASKTQSDIYLCPLNDQWADGAYTTSGDCTTTPGSDQERRAITFDSQVTVSTTWSTDGLIFTADGALTSNLAVTPITLGGTSSTVTKRKIRVTTMGTSKVERVGGGA